MKWNKTIVEVFQMSLTKMQNCDNLYAVNYANQKTIVFPLIGNTDSVHGVLSLPAVQPRRQQLLQLQQLQVGLWVLVAEVEDDLQPLHQLLQTLLCTRLSCLGQVLFSP